MTYLFLCVYNKYVVLAPFLQKLHSSYFASKAFLRNSANHVKNHIYLKENKNMKRISLNRSTWILSIVSTLLTVAVIVLTCILITKTKADEDKSSFQQYYDNKCSAYLTENTNYAKGQIVFIGDSITDLYVLDDYYADLPLATYNRGIGGDTTSGVLKRLKVSLFDIAPSKIVLMIGTNDVNGKVSSDVILQRYEEILQKIYEALPTVELYCMSLIPQNEDIEKYSSVSVADNTETILALNQEISVLAQSFGATYLDLFSLVANENNRLIKTYSDDGLHLNTNGFAVWTALIKPYLL